MTPHVCTVFQDIWNKTWYPKAADHITTEKTWYIVDATDKILGRLASTIAIHIRGKNLVTYTPSVDMGAYVIVVCIMHQPVFGLGFCLPAVTCTDHPVNIQPARTFFLGLQFVMLYTYDF